MNTNKINSALRLLSAVIAIASMSTASANANGIARGVTFQSLVSSDANLPAVKIYNAEQSVKDGHYDRAVLNYMDAIKSGQTSAAYNIAELIKAGKVNGSVLQSSLTDLSVLAAHDGNISYFLGVYYKEIAKNPDDKLSFKWLNNSLSLGCIDAAPMVAAYVLSGLGSANQMYTHENAASMLKLSADNGDFTSAYELAQMIYSDTLVAKNMQVAYQYYAIAASHEYKDSVFMLAYMNEFSLGCVSDIDKAVKMYKAVLDDPTYNKQTRADAANRLARIFMYGKGDVKQDRFNGVSFLTKAADLGQIEASTKLGLLKLYGDKSFKVDINSAIKRLKYASTGGSKIATNTLYQIYENGLYGVNVDSQLASKYKLKMINI